MNFTNGYELIYEKDGKFFGSATRVPTENDTELSITREEIEGYKLVYAKGNAILGSTTGIPSEDDTVLVSVNEEAKEEVVAAAAEEATEEPVEDETFTEDDVAEVTEADDAE